MHPAVGLHPWSRACLEAVICSSLLQLVWGLDPDVNLKAWTCGILLSHMAAAAGRLKVMHLEMVRFAPPALNSACTCSQPCEVLYTTGLRDDLASWLCTGGNVAKA